MASNLPIPAFPGRRRLQPDARVSTSVVSRNGVGGLTFRHDEQHHYDLEIQGWELDARVRLAGIADVTKPSLPPGPIVLFDGDAEPRSTRIRLVPRGGRRW